ncbi:MAG: response regulator transcription factor [Bacteroidetes bacterium]|nr:response regulator transcription factor [Bacteroidota bacterium]
MVKAVIIEDEVHAFNRLNTILKNNFQSEIEIIGSADGVKSGVKIIEDLKPSLVFMDIQINEGTGFDILDYFNGQATFEIIFTTGLIDYKEKAMDYFAFYYLNKPIQETQLIAVINKYLSRKTRFDMESYLAFKHQINGENKTVAIPSTHGGYQILELKNIIYCEADGSYTKFYTTDNKELLTSHNLARFDELFSQSSAFYRIHRSVLINMKHVKEYLPDGTVILTNKMKVNVSIRSRAGFIRMMKLTNYSID